MKYNFLQKFKHSTTQKSSKTFSFISSLPKRVILKQSTPWEGGFVVEIWYR